MKERRNKDYSQFLKVRKLMPEITPKIDNGSARLNTSIQCSFLAVIARVKLTMELQ